MSATNLTKNLKLPQFVASDKPSWLGDVNGAMKNIDDGIGVIKGDITKASNTASSAKSQSDANTVTLGNVNTELTNIGNRVTALEAGGGTEQLEQRVNTLSTDVEALQTRTDTFEENISQNSTDITALKGRVDNIEPKVKANADNIKIVQTQTSGFSESIQTLTSGQDDINSRLSVTSATANNALTNTTQNASRITQLSNQLDGLDVFFATTRITSKISGFDLQPSTVYMKNANALIIFPFITKVANLDSDFSYICDINLDENINTSLIGEGFYTDAHVSSLTGGSGTSHGRFYLKKNGNVLQVWFALTSSRLDGAGWVTIAPPQLQLA